jgi:hypothetical protein
MLIFHIYSYYHKENDRVVLETKKEVLDREMLREIKKSVIQMQNQETYREIWSQGLNSIKATTESNQQKLEFIERKLGELEQRLYRDDVKQELKNK